ncbi:MAG: hypothetical protein ABEJ65_03395 [bacterium]
MKFNTYRTIDHKGNVQILELTDIDWPAHEILELEAVDLKAYKNFMTDELEDVSSPIRPQEVNPLIPVPFEFRAGPDEEVKSVEGIVIADTPSALVRFAEKHLIHVEGNSALNGFLEDRNQSKSIPDERKHRLMEELHQGPNDRQSPYNAFPLVHIPRESWNSPRVDKRTHETLEIHDREHEGDDIKLMSRLCVEYFTPRRIKGNTREIRDKTENRNNRFQFQPSRYRPFYYTDWNGPKDSEDERNLESIDRVNGLSAENDNNISNYSWRSGSGAGVVNHANEMPLSVLENLDETGRQIAQPEGIGSAIPMTFIRPQWVFTVDSTKLREVVSESIEIQALDHRFISEGHHENRWYLFDERSATGETKLPSDNSADERADEEEIAREINDEQILAYLIQRTRDNVYDPERSPRRQPISDLGFNRLQFVLGTSKV